LLARPPNESGRPSSSISGERRERGGREGEGTVRCVDEGVRASAVVRVDYPVGLITRLRLKEAEVKAEMLLATVVCLRVGGLLLLLSSLLLALFESTLN
jgi:hypothetical protein